MKRTSVFVVVLCGQERHGWIHPALALAMTQWTLDERLDLEFQLAQGYPTSQEARNWACAEFLRSDHTHLLMIDNDTLPILNGRVVNLPELALLTDPAGAPLDVVAAPIPVLQRGKLYLNCYMREATGLYRGSYASEFGEARASDDLLERDAVGTGAIAIRREVVQRFTEAPYAHVPGPLRNLLPEGPDLACPSTVFLRPRRPDGATALGEDLLFCERARAFGFRCWTSIQHLCGHVHSLDLLGLPEVQIAIKDPGPPRPEQCPWRAVDYGLVEPIPPITSYSITPHIAEFLRELIRFGCRNVLELGSGISTLVLDDELRRLGKGEWSLRSLEQDADRTTELTELLKKRPDTGFRSRVLHASLSPETKWYARVDFLLPFSPPGAVQLLFIDGPPGAAAPLARYPALPRLQARLAPGCLIVLDDYHRTDEQECARLWLKEFPQLCRIRPIPLPQTDPAIWGDIDGGRAIWVEVEGGRRLAVFEWRP